MCSHSGCQTWQKVSCDDLDRLSPEYTLGIHTDYADVQLILGMQRHDSCLSGHPSLYLRHGITYRVEKEACRFRHVSTLPVQPILLTLAVTPASDRMSCLDSSRHYRHRYSCLSLPIHRFSLTPCWKAQESCSRRSCQLLCRSVCTTQRDISLL